MTPEELEVLADRVQRGREIRSQISDLMKSKDELEKICRTGDQGKSLRDECQALCNRLPGMKLSLLLESLQAGIAAKTAALEGEFQNI
jgi:hypothetical protein